MIARPRIIFVLMMLGGVVGTGPPASAQNGNALPDQQNITAATPLLSNVGPPSSAQESSVTTPLHYYFVGKPVEMDLDRARLGVLFKTDLPRTERAAQIEVLGLPAISIEPTPVAGWALLDLSNPLSGAIDARSRLDTMADSSDVEFVSPVFRGRDGGPVMIAPEILIRLKDEHADKINALLADIEPSLHILKSNFGNFAGGFILRGSDRNGFDVLARANRLALDSRVLWAEPDMQFTGRGGLIPNDTGFANCWGHRNTGQFGGVAGKDMDSDLAWDVTLGSPEVKVLILDTGVQQDHPDINQLPGNDFTSDASTDGGPVNVCDNHGTAVAGCVSAIINNNLGTVGMAPGCKVISARFSISNLSCDGSWSAFSSWIANAISWGETQGAQVSNDSNFYGGLASNAIRNAYASTRANGMIHFASAGNFAQALITYPSSLNSVNSVAALATDGNLASFSNWGVGLAFSAPGEFIYTTDRTGAAGWVAGDYVFANGTSFASPYTAGIAALILSNTPTLNVDQVEEILQLTAVDLGAPGYDTTFGWGFVNADNAVNVITDCNGNGIPDSTDIDGGTSTDCSANGIPDECEPDCNANGTADSCDIFAGTSIDCDANDIPDDCETDTDGDDTIDACDACLNEPALVNPSEPDTELTCNDLIDNDCDGTTDGADPDCFAAVCPFTDDFERATGNTVGNGWVEAGGNPGAIAIETDGLDTYCLLSRNGVSITQSIIDTTGLSGISLDYDWRDNRATDAADSLIVQWKPSADASFITLATHVLTQATFLSESHALPASAENTTIDIRFLTAVASNFKGAHVDNVAVCGGVPCPDADGDGSCDADDGCPADPNKTAPGQCGCGNPDTDTDGDGTADCNDACPNDPAKIAPGVCGCGTPDTDTDGDLTPDCNDGCPNDPLKTSPGICDCGVPDTDTDGDATPDCIDGCPIDPNKTDPGQCGCGVPDTDTDGDATPDCLDACPNEPALVNPSEPGTELTCNDLIDNDCDGLTDAADPDCAAGCPFTCGDINGSGGNADLVDFAAFALCFGQNGPGGACPDPVIFACSDLDGNGATNLLDFATFSLLFGASSVNVPPNCP